jgi:hypothetical protein
MGFGKVGPQLQSAPDARAGLQNVTFLPVQDAPG